MPTSLSPFAVLGEWSFERVIDDRHAGEVLSVRGSTVISEVSDGRLRWAEVGTMRLRGEGRPVHRTLFIGCRPGGDWQVMFDDGRDFHSWVPGSEVEHFCGADVYRGVIDVGPALPDAWSVTWEVSGPSKDYVMRTELNRRPRDRSG